MGEHGAGTVQRLPNGRLRVAVTMPDGRRVWRRARTEREAERIRRQLVEMRELDLDPTRQTVAAFLRSWTDGLRTAHNQRVRPRTLDHYDLIVERHIIPALGTLTLARLTSRRIQAWLDADPAAPRTVRHHHAVLRRAMNVAVRQRLLPYNPALAVELPPVAADKADPLTGEEVDRLLDATKDDRLGALWRLAIATGFRVAELTGLAWDDIAGDRVTVAGQLQRRDGGWVRSRTKAARSLDTVTVGPGTAAALEAHRIRQATARQPDWEYWGLVFLTEAGRPLHQSEVLKAFRRACAKAGIRERRVHDLRHTNLTLLRDAGVAEDTRMARAGHSTTTMARRYAKASEAQDRDAADRLSRASGGRL